jgi:hypothetical protein
VPTERITVRLPAGFDPAKHLKALERLVADKHGDGWEIESIDPAAGTAYATRQVAVTEVDAGEQSKDRFEVRLPRGTKPSDGEKVATKLEDQHSGFVLVEFEPFLGRATLARLTSAEQRCRGAVAVALSVKPWDVQVTARPDGGFDLVLPRSYVPSKHDGKLEEVATAVVGAEGWYVEVDARALTASLIPGDPPTFPPVIPYPFKKAVPRFDPAGDAWARIPLGRVLGRTGGEDGPELTTDFAVAPHGLASGLTGAGKSILLTTLATGALARGWELCLVDAIKGGVDFVAFERLVRPGGWADDLSSACCVLQMAYEEGQRRKRLIQQAGAQRWTQLPTSANLRPVLVVVDELTSLVAAEPTPKGVAKDNPLVLEVAERNLLKASILNTIAKIARELRFTGISLAIGTQVASTATGIPTELRGNLGLKLLLGSKPTDNNRRLALNDPDAVPRVPLNIVNDPNGAARGVGVYELEGREPGIVKVLFANPTECATYLQALGVPTTDRPRPTPAEIAKHTPSIDTSDANQAGSDPGRSGDRSPSGKLRPEPTRDPATGEVLRGFEKANEQRRQLDAAARQAHREDGAEVF